MGAPRHEDLQAQYRAASDSWALLMQLSNQTAWLLPTIAILDLGASFYYLGGHPGLRFVLLLAGGVILLVYAHGFAKLTLYRDAQTAFMHELETNYLRLSQSPRDTASSRQVLTRNKVAARLDSIPLIGRTVLAWRAGISYFLLLWLMASALVAVAVLSLAYPSAL